MPQPTITPLLPEAAAAFERLASIVAELRQKCPWDRAQTMDSLRHLTIEETYELAEAITAANPPEIRAELGDLMLHLLFYTRMAEEQGAFSLAEMLNAQCEKLIRRHPHVYGDASQALGDAEAVRAHWEHIKQREHPQPKSVLAGVPVAMPSLVQAYRMQEKAAQVGFDWPDMEGVRAKITEELAEFDAADTPQTREAEMGDLLFSLVNYCRRVGINPDDALARTNAKFRRRFLHIEQQAWAAGRQVQELTLDEMEAHWQAAKTLPQP